MLTSLRIRNFAIIESLALPLRPGLNVLSGETGAGKSIIVGALGFLLGERASADLVRTGSERATVEGVFELGDAPDIARALDERGVEAEDGVLVFKREVATTGRARAWINGSTVTASVMGDIGRLFVSLHGQHEAQALLDGDSQRQILDAFGGAGADASRVRELFGELSSVRAEMASLASRRADAERRADYLRHVAKEIDEARLVEGEELALEDEGRRLEHAEELRGLASGMATALEGDEDAVVRRLAALQRSLAAIRRIDPSLERLQELFDTSYYAIEELARALDAYASSIDMDPARLDEVTRRREIIFRLTKKYGPTVGEVLDTARRARAELDLVDSAALDLSQLAVRERDIRDRLGRAAAHLTELRTEAAARLATAVDAVLPDLGMPDGMLTVALVPRADIAAAGAEDIELRITLNKGHAARALARVASGGELSRVMLALKTILARVDRVPTLVFDEVDAGIGGRIGLQVGDTMRRVAAHHQVFAISHLPQIAARAHHHIVVSKSDVGGVTAADVNVLDGEARVIELARMLGGDSSSEVSRAHARELLAGATSADAVPARSRTRATVRRPSRN